MTVFTTSRRTILGSVLGGALAGGGAARAGAAQVGGALPGGTLTAGAVIERIMARTGAPWRGTGVDGFKAGSSATPVTGIVTTMMATLDALKAAQRQGLNLVITHEPTYWSHQDTVTHLQDDPLYRAKLGFLERHAMAAYHLHDNWHALRPIDGINAGMVRLMGWGAFMHADNQRLFTVPPTTLTGLAEEFRRKTGIRTMRIVGDPALPVRTVYESWGNCGVFPGVTFLAGADVLVIGETQDWDLIAYAQDLVATGARKGLIVLGHVKSEQWGMEYCADWLREFVPEVPVQFVPLIEPYWMVDEPVFEIDTQSIGA